MAKEKSGAGAVVLRGQAVQAAANGFVQSALLTGLSAAGNDALVVKQIQVELPSLLLAAAGIFEQEVVISRASKAAMPNLFDDDVVWKGKLELSREAAGAYVTGGILSFVPQTEIVLIEDTIYFDFKTLNCTLAGTAVVRIDAQPATVTESEKVGLLLTRLN